MKRFSAAVGIFLIIGLAGCSSPDREQAKEQARSDVRKVKADAKELGNRIDAAVKPDSESASQKLAAAGNQAQAAASKAGNKLDHAALLAQVKTKLVSDVGLSTIANVDVSLNGSVVTLSGTVANADQKTAAEKAAAQVDGVTLVQNRLTVQP
jgi:osmotically-inducible protein OsmY